MNRYKLSLIAPIYGVEPYIEKFAKSALGQTFTNMEFIFVNDGTKDKSIEILESLIEKEFSHLKERITIINKENQGLPLARKTGMDAAQGEYILFADSDDWLEVTAAEKIMSVAEKADADIVYYDLVKEYGDRQSIKAEKEYTAETKRQFIKNIFNYTSYGYTVTKCFRRSIYTDNKIFIPKLGMHEDIYLMAQIIFYANSLVHLPEPLYHYRKDNPGAMCSQKREKRHLASSRNLLDLYYNYKENLKGSPIEDVASGIVLRAGWHSIIHNAGLFKEFPWLAKAVKESKPGFGYRTPFLFQLIVKAYAAFKR